LTWHNWQELYTGLNRVVLGSVYKQGVYLPGVRVPTPLEFTSKSVPFVFNGGPGVYIWGGGSGVTIIAAGGTDL